MKKIVSFFMAATLAATLVAPSADLSQVNAAQKGIRLNATKKVLRKGSTFVIKCKGTKKKVKWSLSNKKIVKVVKKKKNTLKIKAIRYGKVVVTAKVGKKKKKCTIIVRKKQTSSTTASPTTQQPTTEKRTETTTQKTTEVQGTTEKPATTEPTTEIATERPASTETTTEIATEGQTSTEITTEIVTERPTSTETTTEVATECPASTETTTEIATERPTSTEMTTEITTECPTTTEATTEVSTQQPTTTETSTEIATEQQTTTETSTEIATEQQTTTETGTEIATEQQTTTETSTEIATEQQTTTETGTEIATEQQTTTEISTETTTEESTTELEVHAVLYTEAQERTAEDYAHRDNEAQVDIESSFDFPTYTGDGTFYGGGYTGGCCNLDNMTNGYYVCAMNKPQYNIAQLAGTYIEITGPTGTIKALVADELPEGKYGDVDMNTELFPMVANVEDGRVPISWKIVPFPTDEPIKYWIKADSTEYWMQIQLRNHRYPISKLEIQKADGSFVEVPKRNYNFFEIGASTIGEPGPGPYTFRVTDINGQVLVDTIPFMPGYIIDGKTNFDY